ncbi:recombinase family protein [Candidatus Solirubrobacter pratensis]|uniref:recombinase family protein n=1 Tax=Candidatus Solirubrobacter pratensis TaxID=1298857 RepID=UPI0003F762A0|nr:recombinase family protein [Candidatus Solirubrobacter pratensis]
MTGKRRNDRLRIDGYIRISLVGKRRGEQFISPVVQREEIEGWARRHDAEIVRVYEELDESGRRPDRPMLEAIAHRIELGVTRGVVVATVDRFGRSELDALLTIRRIQNAGGHFFSAREDFDLGSEVGRYLCRELLSIAEFQSDRLSVGWRQAKDKLIARGAWPASRVPFGYRRARSGKLTPDPRTGSYVTELFRRRAAGATVRELCRYLETEQVRTPNGHSGWAPGTLENIFRHRAYLGEIQWGATNRPHAHPPLVDGATWERAQRPPIRSRRRTGNTSPLLRGLVRCAGCSMSMSSITVRTPQGRVYRCYWCAGRSAGGPCPARAYIQVAPLDAYVVETALEVLAHRRSRRPVAVTAATATLEQAERALRRYRDNDRLIERLDPHAYADGLLVKDRRVREARLAVALAREADELDQLPLAGEIKQRWPAMTTDERRGILARIIDCVFVGSGRLPAPDRVTICPRGTAPPNLPRIGDKKTRARPFRPRRGVRRRPGTGTRPAHRWSNDRLERELRDFLSGRPHWPAPDVFICAGRGELLQQARLRARDEWWAFHFRLPMQEPPRPPRPWTDERILNELTAYLDGKPQWPTIPEFRAAGKHALRWRVGQTGGLKRWAPLFPEVACPQLHRWNDDEIRRQLVEFCNDRARFPTQAEFSAAGRSGLLHVLGRRGASWWANQLSLPRARDCSAAPPEGSGATARSACDDRRE